MPLFIKSVLFNRLEDKATMSDSDDDIPQLSVATLAALQQFYDEQKVDQEQATDLNSVGAVDEDWVGHLTSYTQNNCKQMLN